MNKLSFYNQQPAKNVPFWVAFTVLYLSLKKASLTKREIKTIDKLKTGGYNGKVHVFWTNLNFTNNKGKL